MHGGSSRDTLLGSLGFATAVAAAICLAVSASCARGAGTPEVDEPGSGTGTGSPSAAGVCDPAVHGDVDRLAPARQTVVTLWHPYSGENEALLTEMIDEFNRTNGARVIVKLRRAEG